MDSPDPTAEPVSTDPEAELADPEQDAIDAVAGEGQARLWVRTITTLLQLRSHDTDPSSRVQYAFDQMFVAACERVVRILRSDLPG